jgi:hypothetical protein
MRDSRLAFTSARVSRARRRGRLWSGISSAVARTDARRVAALADDGADGWMGL